MKKQNSIMFFVSVQIVLVFLQIHQHSTFINQSFAKQKNEKLISELEQCKQDATHELALARDFQAIQQFAQTTLAMQPITLHQIKKLTVHNNDAAQPIFKNTTHPSKNNIVGNNITHTPNSTHEIMAAITSPMPEIETLSLLLPLPDDPKHITLACNNELNMSHDHNSDFTNTLNHTNHSDACDQPV